MATISSLLADHVSLQVRCVDRVFLQGYVPRLMCEGPVIRLAVVNGVPAEIPFRKEGGIGLENLRRRLELLYPGRHSLMAEKKGQQFESVLTIEYK